MEGLPIHRQRQSSSTHTGGGGGGSSTSGSVGSGSAANALTLLKSPAPSLGSASKPAPSSSIRDQQVDKLLKEVKQLKQKVDILDKENTALKKSIYDLSARYAAAISQGGLPFQPRPLTFESTAAGQHEMSHKAQQVITKAVQEAGGDVVDTAKSAFEMRYELKGHTGAVYTVEFSPSGALLASGSFDKTVRIWDTASAQKEMLCLKGHTLNIASVAWTSESKMLLSGSYDETCKTWDVETGRLMGSYEMEGFAQCVGWDYINSNVFYCGTSRKNLSIVDIRLDPSERMTLIKNDAMVNTLYASRDGIHVITGDAQGVLKVWDIRSKQCISRTVNDNGKMPITHITIGRRSTDASRRSLNDYDEPRYMAVNSYDNILRVYDRGMDPPKSETRLVHALKGFKNKYWPIKSSFYCGTGYNSSIISRPSGSVLGALDGDAILASAGDYFDSPKPREENSVLLATGSADPFAYLYNVGEESAELMQRLEGHTDRVYAVNFHPTEPILASGSADFTVKIWGPGLSRGKKKAIL